eukprot:11393285-Alexandrium_andersonii.AAC.1
MAPLPFLIAGDLNGLPEHFPLLDAQIQSGSIYDVAAMEGFTGQSHGLLTCKAHGKARETRRDYCFVSCRALQWVKRVWARGDAGFDVHRPLHIEFDASDDGPVSLLKKAAPILRPSEVPPASWSAELEKAATSAFARVESELQRALDEAKTTRFYSLWSEAHEQALLETSKAFGRPLGPEARGHGQ